MPVRETDIGRDFRRRKREMSERGFVQDEGWRDCLA
jgi:hypothetical protein